MEVVLSEPVWYYWDFDNPKNFAADGPTPGKYLFSNGATGAVKKEADGLAGQVKADHVAWAVKFNKDKLALGLVTPETTPAFTIGPGGGFGGVGIESSTPASHFVTFAGVLDNAPAATMDRLLKTLDFRNPPEVVLYALETNSKKAGA